jgi:hypothetical protein
MKKLPVWRWASGLLCALLVLAANLPDAVVVSRNAQGQQTGQTAFHPFAVAWTFTYVAIALACILFGGRVAQVIGFVLLAIGLWS